MFGRGVEQAAAIALSGNAGDDIDIAPLFVEMIGHARDVVASGDIGCDGVNVATDVFRGNFESIFVARDKDERGTLRCKTFGDRQSQSG